MNQVSAGGLAKVKALGSRFSWQDIGPIIAVIALMILGAINPTFLSMGNLTNVFTRSALTRIIAIRATLSSAQAASICL